MAAAIAIGILHGGWAHGREPTPDELSKAETRLAQARAFAQDPQSPLNPEARSLLHARVTQAEEALAAYWRLRVPEQTRQHVAKPLWTAGAALLADDVTGVGSMNDVLLPVIGLGLLATYTLPQGSSSAPQLEAAWRETATAMQVVAHTVQILSAQSGLRPPGDGPGWTKLRGDQGWKDPEGDVWKKDQLHKDHWDVSDRKGNKVREVDFQGKQIWPSGPKNKNKGRAGSP